MVICKKVVSKGWCKVSRCTNKKNLGEPLPTMYDSRSVMRQPAFCSPSTSKTRNFKPLAIFCCCKARFVSDIVRNSEGRFCRDAHFLEKCQKHDWSRIVRNPAFCKCENKDADQLRGNREADQHLCFCYTDSTIPLLLKSEISSL